MKRFNDGRDWFFHQRFGLFVHWGLYALDGWHEQMQFRRQIPKRDYAKLASRFDPQQFDPDRWIDLAEEAGMGYICFTTKHIDGFCMFHSRYTDYHVGHTPYGRDVLKELADACHRRSMPLVLYYAVPDMHHPSYPGRGRAYERADLEPGDAPDPDKYVEYMKNQVEELCTGYGELHGFWWDGGHLLDVRDPSVNARIRELQPKAVINDRGLDEGDFGTPERDWYDYVDTAPAFDKPTEACQSIGAESWGYREDEDYYAERYLMESIVKILAKGGNYLLNAGPRGDGSFPPEACRILRNAGRWLKPVRRALFEARPAAGLADNPDVLLTRSGNTLYVHLYKLPKTDCVWLKPIDVAPVSARLLHTGEPVEACVEATPSLFREQQGMLRIRRLPVDAYTDRIMVLELVFDRFPEHADPSVAPPEVRL